MGQGVDATLLQVLLKVLDTRQNAVSPAPSGLGIVQIHVLLGCSPVVAEVDVVRSNRRGSIVLEADVVLHHSVPIADTESIGFTVSEPSDAVPGDGLEGGGLVKCACVPADVSERDGLTGKPLGLRKYIVVVIDLARGDGGSGGDRGEN